MKDKTQHTEALSMTIDSVMKTAHAVIGFLNEALAELSPWTRLSNRVPDQSAAISRLRGAREHFVGEGEFCFD